MKFVMIVSALFIVQVLCISQLSINQYSAEIVQSEKFSVADLIEDLETLKIWIEEAHGDPFRFITTEEFELLFKQARRKVSESSGMTHWEFYPIVMEIIASLKDGHSQAFTNDLNKVPGKSFFPFKLRFYKNEAYLLENYNNEFPIPVGAKILSINNVPAKEYFDSFLPFIHRDGNSLVVRYRRMESPVYMAKLFKAFQPETDKLELTIESAKGIMEFAIPMVDQVAYNNMVNKPTSSHKMPMELLVEETDGGVKVPVITIRSFNPSYFKDSYDFFKESFDQLLKEAIDINSEAIAIDVRNNAGGEDSYVLHVLRSLMNEEFVMNSEITFQKNDYKFLPDGRHWDIDPKSFRKNDQGTYDATSYLWPDGPSTLGSFKPYKTSYKGRLFVLVNAGTFSAGVDFAAPLKYNKRAIIIGEETGGSYIGVVGGYNPTLRLPNSSVKLNLALISIKRPFYESEFTDRGVIPNIIVEQTINERIENIDATLNALKAQFD